MGNVGAGFSMSLDGFIAGPGGDFGRLFQWYAGGDTAITFPGGMVVKVSPASAAHIRAVHLQTGAIVSGRRLFDLTGGWGGRHPLDVPVFVVTHTVPREWVYEGSPFTFVTDGVAIAIRQAQHAAGGKNVAVGSANIMQQCLKAGLLDEIHIDLVPVLLGGGVRLFEHLGTGPIELERTRAIAAPGVTHLTFRVVRN